jgi:hypothetical protein
MLTAFGDSDYPIRFSKNAQDCAKKLADDVLNFDFDGVEIDFRDDYAL